MKLKKIELSDCDYESLQKIHKFSYVLFRLNIKTAGDFCDSVVDEMQDNFCSDCESLKDDCECRSHERDYDYDMDEDRLYDAWKDQQIMDED